MQKSMKEMVNRKESLLFPQGQKELVVEIHESFADLQHKLEQAGLILGL